MKLFKSTLILFISCLFLVTGCQNDSTLSTSQSNQEVSAANSEQVRENAKEIYNAIKTRFEKKENLSDYEIQIINEFTQEKVGENEITLQMGISLLVTSFEKYREAIDKQGGPEDNKYKKEVQEQLDSLKAVHFKDN